MTSVKPRRSYSISAVDRAAAVLDAVARTKPRLLTEIAHEAELDEATTLRYLSSLSGHGFVERDDDSGAYSLGIRLYQLGQQALGLRDVRKIALVHMERLLERFEETVNLAHSRSGKLVVMEVLESPRSIRKGASLGDIDEWHASALGKSILASMPPAEARAFLEGIERPRFTEHTLVGIDEILENLATVARRGYAIDDEEFEQGLRCVAAAVSDGRGRPMYSISISGVAVRMPREVTEEIGIAVVAAAEAVSNALGYLPEEEQRAQPEPEQDLT